MANLTQLKMLEELDGFLLVDKPAGIAFASVLKAVKRKFNLVKVGHGGSLDAQASGLFVILIGDANKFVGEVMGADREYTGALKLGETTDTGDAWGRPIPLPARLATLDDLKGDVFQVEPRFCAIRKEGTSEYEVVDTGEHQQFLAHVYRMKVEEVEDVEKVEEVEKGEGVEKGEEVEKGEGVEKVKKVRFELKASKGVIVRALAQDMGATLLSLRRTKVGKFDVADAVPFDKLLETEMKDFSSVVTPLSVALKH